MVVGDRDDELLGRCLEAYGYLFRIENVLRELIAEVMRQTHGARWLRQVPGGADSPRDHIQANTPKEREGGWRGIMVRSPLYYADLGDLSQIIAARHNWDDGFSRFAFSKEAVHALIARLAPVRNRVAHFRGVAPEDCDVVKGAWAEVRGWIGSKAEELLERCCHGVSIGDKLQGLADELRAAELLLSKVPDVVQVTVWEQVRAADWFDDEFLGLDSQPVRQAYALLHEYHGLPRGIGTGLDRKRWLERRGCIAALANARRAIEHLLEGGGQVGSKPV